MPLDVQTRLLRVLADGQFYRVGGYAPVKVDVRIIAATHQNPELRVQEGKFREDLFHRLNVIRVHRRCASAVKTSRGWRATSADRRQRVRRRSQNLHPETETALTRLPGRATCASWRTPAAG